MIRAIIDLPTFSELTHTSIKEAKDVYIILRAKEYRILWNSEAPEFFPSYIAAEFIRFAFVMDSNIPSKEL
jgi:hypothetical protein